jgi:outer membrane lipoprotein SlyB
MMKFNTALLIAVLSASPVFAHAGDYDISADGNTRSGTLREGKVMEGKIINVRTVDIESSTKAQYTGTAIGAAAGAVIASQVGAKNSFLLNSLGGLVGGAVGNVATDKLMHATAQELIILKTDGKATTITQADSELKEGQNVYLVESAGKIRVIPKNDTPAAE